MLYLDCFSMGYLYGHKKQLILKKFEYNSSNTILEVISKCKKMAILQIYATQIADSCHMIGLLCKAHTYEIFPDSHRDSIF